MKAAEKSKKKREFPEGSRGEKRNPKYLYLE